MFQEHEDLSRKKKLHSRIPSEIFLKQSDS